MGQGADKFEQNSRHSDGLRKWSIASLLMRRYGFCVVARSGAARSNSFGHWNSVFKRFARWSRLGVWEKIRKSCAGQAALENICIDRAPSHALTLVQQGLRKATKLPRHWGALVMVFSCKIHAVADALSWSVHFILTGGHAAVDALGPPLRWPLNAGQVGGQLADVTRALALIERIEVQAVLADKAYDANHLLKRPAQRNIQAVFPPKANRTEQRQYDQLCA